MALNINFVGRTQCEGNYVDLDIQIAPKQATDDPDTRKANIRMKYWKDKATRNLVNSIPFNDQMNGAGDSRITGFNCNYQFDYDLNSPLNIFQQGYKYLKTLPEFSEAIDDITEEQSTQLGAVKNVNLGRII